MRGSVDERNRKSIIPWSIILAVFWVVTSFIYSAPEYAKDSIRTADYLYILVNSYIINIKMRRKLLWYN